MSTFSHMQDPNFRRIRNIVLEECIKEVSGISIRSDSFNGSQQRHASLMDVISKLKGMIHVEKEEKEAMLDELMQSVVFANRCGITISSITIDSKSFEMMFGDEINITYIDGPICEIEIIKDHR